MMKRKLNAKFKKSMIPIVMMCVVFICASVYMLLTTSQIQFTNEREVEINSDVDYSKFIKKVKDGHKEDVKIDSSRVDIHHLGEYQVTYQYKKESRDLRIKVVDSVAPECDVKEGKVALNQQADPYRFVENIKDATQTKVYFDKDYKFNKEGKQTIQLVIEDEASNKTYKKTTVDVVPDTTPPQIIASNASILVGSDISIESLVTLNDDFDSNPTLSINKGNFDNQKVGHYQVELTAMDASKNKSKKTITIQVIDETRKDEKVVYLTFDDGPSKYTAQVLDILDKYHCKATFFITGMNASYRKYITMAHDKGHTIGLHTYSHKYNKVYASTDAYFKDLEKIGKLAKDYIGYTPKYIRFPGGSSNTISKRYSKGIMSKLSKMVEDKGYIYYDWNAENGDGYSNMSKKEMYKRATSSREKQIMILMHDANGKQNTVDILPDVIEYYQSKGYVFKAIDDSSIVPHQNVLN